MVGCNHLNYLNHLNVFFGMARSFEQLAAPPPATMATAKGPGMPVVYKAWSKSCGFFWEVTSGYFCYLWLSVLSSYWLKSWLFTIASVSVKLYNYLHLLVGNYFFIFTVKGIYTYTINDYARIYYRYDSVEVTTSTQSASLFRCILGPVIPFP